MDNKILNKINEVEDYLMKLLDQLYVLTKEDLLLTTGLPCDSLCYGEALVAWEQEKKEKNPNSFFSTDDPVMLRFRKELTKKFGLPVMTHEEAEEHKKLVAKRMPVYTTKVTGFNWN